MKAHQLSDALEDALQQLGVRVRRERGSFRGGYCEVEGEMMVVLNRQHPPEAHLSALAAALRDLPVDEIYLRPAVREALENLWSQREEEVWDAEEE